MSVFFQAYPDLYNLKKSCKNRRSWGVEKCVINTPQLYQQSQIKHLMPILTLYRKFSKFYEFLEPANPQDLRVLQAEKTKFSCSNNLQFLKAVKSKLRKISFFVPQKSSIFNGLL